jgi:glycosyltransferase involved in cell wall biosynthesis
MENKKPKVSIITPTYNRAHFITETLDFIIGQTFTNWECIIIDDGSTDDTKVKLAPYLKKDDRLNYIQRSSRYKKGPSGCRNQGLDTARGDYIIFFDSDDIVHPDVLAICAEILENQDLLFCRYDKTPFVGEWKKLNFDRNRDFKSHLVIKEDIGDMVTNKIPFACCTVMWDKKGIGSFRFNEDLSYAEEWEFYTRILASGISGISINKSLYFNRKHPNSNTGEFWNNHPIRVRSKIQAAKMVINTLSTKKLFNSLLEKYFIRMGFSLNSYNLLNTALEHSEISAISKFKYKLGYLIYPILRPLFILKGKIQSS